MVKRTVSKIMLLLLLIGIFALAFNIQPVRASGTIYIRADGSIDPPDAPISTADYVTYTLTGDITSDAYGIVVERSNIIINGDGYTVEGRYVSESKGIDLSGRSNVTIKNVAVKKFDYGIRLDGSSDNIIQGNTVTNNRHGIYLYLWSSSNNIVSGNNITANNGDGIYLYQSSNNTISGNNITNNDNGIYLWSSSNYNSISGNTITANNRHGIWLWYSSNYNSISGNTITNNYSGIRLYKSTDNNISENNITVNNWRGIMLSWSSDNAIYHNNFVDNTEQVQSEYSINFWDDGYPSGGNYWSDYNGTDLFSGSEQNQSGSDGIGDTFYEIDADNRDVYPLMAPFKTFDAGTWNGTAYNVDVVTNSTVSNFQLDASQKTISFSVSGSEFTAGFCRVTIPNIIIQDLWQGNYTVLLNGEPWPFRNWTDATNTYICINYTHSEHEIIIVPEFPSAMILPLFTLTTLIATVLLKKNRKPKFNSIPFKGGT